MKKSKSDYYTNFFTKNINDIKNTWKGIKKNISNSNIDNSSPNFIIHNNETIIDSKEIANTFNDYFSSVAHKIQVSINFSLRKYDFYLNEISQETLLLSPTDNLEVADLIQALKINKSEGPNGIPTKVLHILKNEISPLLADLFNLSFSTGTVPSVLKIGKVIPIHKKTF